MKDENRPIMGVLGGMGPMATQLFYKMVIENTKATCDQDHINMIILSHASMPDRTEMIKEGKTKELLDKLCNDVEYLANSGAACIAIPCNTTHAVIDELAMHTSVPIINMIRETASVVSDNGAERAGILATDGTIKTGLYQKACEMAGVDPIIPDADVQASVMNIIYGSVKAGRAPGATDLATIAQWRRVEGIETVILGCTELPLVPELANDPGCIDAMLVLARKAISMCGCKLK